MYQKYVQLCLTDILPYFSKDTACLAPLNQLLTRHFEKSEKTIEKAHVIQKMMPLFLAKISSHYDHDNIKLEFVTRFCDLVFGVKSLDLNQFSSINKDLLTKYDQLPDYFQELGKKYATNVAILKLNGGLGTSMGCSGPKSLVNVDGTNSFIDIIAKQVTALRQKTKATIPLILMNSFYTAKDTLEYLEGHLDFYHFEQCHFPRIKSANLMPLETSIQQQDWYPPGHGNIYLSLLTSGVLDKLINDGIEYVFISNSDNLGAVLDFKVLGYMIEHQLNYLMEITEKTSVDIKGGVIAAKDNRFHLVECAQIETEQQQLFEDLEKFPFFNTNNIWLNIRHLKNTLKRKDLELPTIVNAKKVENQPVVQLETAMGAALNQFEKSQLLLVDRNRFIPVKKTSDLMILDSDIFYKDQNLTLTLNPSKSFPSYLKLS